MKLMLLYRRRWWLIYLPILLAFAALLVVTLWLWKPLPPKRLVIGTGPGQSSYLFLARAYANRLERMGIGVEIVSFARPQDALAQLGGAASGPRVDVGFAQGLYASGEHPAQALAVIGHEIVWLFVREGIDSLAQLRGRRIAVSVPGSSSRVAAELLLSHAGLRPADVAFSDAVGDAAISALVDNQVDAVLHVAGGESQTAAALVRMDGVRLLGVERAGALAAREPRLRAVLMPQGSIELRSNLPPSDLPTLVTLTHLLVRPDLHPALQRALLDVAGELHVMTGFLEGQGLYPTTVGSNFAVSNVALQHRNGKRPWLETLLPFGVAQWAELLLFALLPVTLLAALLLLRAPRYIEWRVNAALQHFYGELKFFEEDLQNLDPSDASRLRPLQIRLDHLERQVGAMELPDRFADRWYTLREHLQQARERLQAFKNTDSQPGPVRYSARP